MNSSLYNEQLSKYRNVLPKNGYGNRLSMYLMTLEAWRRGLEITFFLEENEKNRLLIRYKISDGENSYKFNSSLGEKVSKEAFLICNDKHKTKQMLEKAKITVPRGKLVNLADSQESIIEYALSIGYPLVLKPLSENTGKGVYTNIKSETELVDALKAIKKMGHNEAIIEEQVDGTEYRVLVLGERVLAAVKREPANIIGNGKSTIEELIEIKNKTKDDNPNLYNRHIIIDKEVKETLAEKGYSLNSIPFEGEKVYLRNKVTLDGDPLDATDDLPHIAKEVSIQAVKAITGLDLCGLDIIVNSNNTSVTVIEMNTRPMLGLHVFPFEGIPRDVISPIIDHYFPNTKNKESTNLYFNLNEVISPIRERVSSSVVLSPLPIIKEYKVFRVMLEDIKLERKLLIKLSSKAREMEINGSIIEKDDHNWEFILGSLDIKALNQYIEFIKTELNNNLLIDIEELNKKHPVNIGFKIQTISNIRKNNKNLRKRVRTIQRKNKNVQKTNKKLKRKIRKLHKQRKELNIKINQLTKEKENVEKELYNLKNSKSWKITKPLRVITKMFKK